VRNCADRPLDECATVIARTDPGEFIQRPVGGNASFDLSVELRKRLGSAWGVVAFVDIGQVWPSLKDLEAPVLTPGFGARWFGPLGPFRIDIGYNPTRATLLPVVVATETGKLVELERPVLYDPFTFDDPSPLKQFFRRLRFHFSIGEAF
jgi:outer membrane protein assembly factor BamA